MDGKSGIVSLEADDFPHYEKNATVQPSAFIQANLFYLPYFNHGRWDTQGTQRPIFRGGLYLILEALYHSKTEQDFLGYMIRRMSETFGKEKEAESMIFRLPRLSSEEYSILNQSIEGSGFTQERLERIFQKICEDVKKRLGVTLYLERCPE